MLDAIFTLLVATLWAHITVVFLIIRKSRKDWNNGTCKVCGLPIDRLLGSPNNPYDFSLVSCKQHHHVWLSPLLYRREAKRFTRLW